MVDPGLKNGARLLKGVEDGRGPGRAERGAALVELAVVIPLLVLILVGTVDFARVFYTTMELTNAARAGAQYGGTKLSNSANSAAIQSYAISAAPDIAPVTASASSVCWCATDAGAFSGVGCGSSCPSGQHLVVSVTVTATQQFNTVTLFPGIPHTLSLSRVATMRAR